MERIVWKPNVTVAVVVEDQGRFLLVEEQTEEGQLYNQPAGHLEADESLIEAAVRETLEESAYTIQPQFLIGIYQWRPPHKDVTYLRFAFGGQITGHEIDRKLDEGILRAVWLDLGEIKQLKAYHRSPIVLTCIEDYLAGKCYPLELIRHF